MHFTAGGRCKILTLDVVDLKDSMSARLEAERSASHFEDSIPLVRHRLDLDIKRDTLAGDDHIGETVVGNLGPSGLSPEGKIDVSDIGLDTLSGELHLVVVGVDVLGDGWEGGEGERVVGSDGDEVGEEVWSGEDEVLDDNVDRVVRVLGSWDGDVSDLSNERGQDNILDVLPESALEGEVALVVEEEVLGESLDVLAESDVERVVAEGSEPVLDLVEQVLLVTLVLVAEELFAALLELSALLLGLLVEDPSGLEQESVDVVVELGEVTLELGVVVDVGVDLVEGLDHAVHGFTVGESLEQGSEAERGVGDGGVRLEVLGGVDTFTSDVLGVALVVLERVEQPGHGLHVVLVLLGLDNHLLEPVDELLSSLLWQGVVENVLGGVDGVGSGLSVLLWDLLLELLGLVSGLVFGLVSVDVGGVSVGLGAGLVGLVLGSTLELLLLLAQRGVGVSLVVEVFAVGGSLVLGLGLELLFLVDEVVLGLLGLVVGLAGGSGVALGVGDPVERQQNSNKL